MSVTRHRLAAKRRAAGYSQEALAAALNVDRTTVTRWETAESQPQPWHRRKIAKVLGVSLEELDDLLRDIIDSSEAAALSAAKPNTSQVAPIIPEQRSAVGHGPPLDQQSDRRQFLTDGTRLAGVALSEHLVRLFSSEAHAMRRALDAGSSAETLAAYAATADQMMIHYERHGPVDLLGPVLELFGALRRLVEQPQPRQARRQLTRTASKLATLLGIFAYDNAWRARTWFGVAQGAAVEAGDRTLLGWAIAAESLGDYYGGRASAACQSLAGARRLVDGGVVAAVVAARLARSYAVLGDARQALSTLDEAECLLDGAPVEQRELYGFSAPQLAFYRTTVLLRLGRHDEVQAAATEALGLYAETPHHMDPTLIRIEAANAHLTGRPPAVEQAAAEARDALESLPAAHRTGPVRQRAGELAVRFRNYLDVPAAREFVEYLAQL